MVQKKRAKINCENRWEFLKTHSTQFAKVYGNEDLMIHKYMSNGV